MTKIYNSLFYMTRTRYNEIYDKVSLFKEKNDISGVVVNLRKVCENIGVKVIPYNLGEVSSVIMMEPGNICIGVGLSQNSSIRQFGIAHSLGHLALHQSMGEIFIDVNYLVKKYKENVKKLDVQREEEANVYASLLLISDEQLMQECKSPAKNEECLLKRIAKKYNMPLHMVVYRVNLYNKYNF